MNILFIGDIMGETGRNAVHKYLYDIKSELNIDFCIANGENLSHGNGISREAYSEMQRAGIDFFTMGNHVWRNREIVSLFSENADIVRPLNLPSGVPGDGYAIIPLRNGQKIAVVNLIGRTYMESNFDNPFLAAEKAVEEISKITPIIIADFHAEATSEKISLGYFLDGKASAVLGTHTHVQTNDAKILKNGTAYITDVGMTGARDSVLGIKPENAINRFLTTIPQKHEIAIGKTQFNAVLLEIDETGKALKIEIIKKVDE